MPEFSGIEIIQTLERESILKGQKIIIFSAASLTSVEIMKLLEKDGIQEYLKKPIQLKDLLNAIAS